MSKPSRRICLVTPGHLASTPRIVKEAEALTEAGYDVHLIASNHFPPVEPLDQAVLARANWRTTRVRAYAGPAAFVCRAWRWWLRRRCLSPGQVTLRRALRLLHPGLPALIRAAVKVPADFYHGHCVAGLAVAAQAARRRGVPYGFDAEDFHEAETETLEQDERERAVVSRILQAWLPGCRIRTAAAPLIAEEYRRCHGVPMAVVLNVFPLRDAPATATPVRPISAGSPARLYWFSQTVGAGRGLERIIAVMAMMKTPVELHLRGQVSVEDAARLRRLAAAAGVPDALRLLPSASPDEMVRLAAECDLGLSLEESRPRNRDLCLTNKVFVYVLAGIPQVFSRTAGQSAIAPELGDAGLLVDFDAPGITARRLDEFLQDELRVRAARAAAWRLGRTRFCWEVEKHKLLSAFRTALN